MRFHGRRVTKVGPGVKHGRITDPQQVLPLAKFAFEAHALGNPEARDNAPLNFLPWISVVSLFGERACLAMPAKWRKPGAMTSPRRLANMGPYVKDRDAALHGFLQFHTLRSVHKRRGSVGHREKQRGRPVRH